MNTPSRTYKLTHPDTGDQILVSATFYRGCAATQWQPGEDDSANIMSVIFEDVDLIDVITDALYAEIETAWLAAYYDEHAQFVEDENEKI